MVTSVAAAAVLLAPASSALADGSLTRAGNQITYAGAPGDVDAIALSTSLSFSGWIARFDAIGARGGVPVQSPGRTCVGASEGFSFTGCFAGPDDVATFDLGDRDDYVELGGRQGTGPTAPPLFPKAVIHGGTGIDTVHYTEPVRASLDGVANDGPAGFANDNVGSDVEVLEGSDGNDRLTGGPGANTLLGDGGDDEIVAIDDTADVIDCGAGDDLAVVDAIDTTRNCETLAESGRAVVAPAAPLAPAAPAEPTPAQVVAQRVLAGVDDKWLVTKRYTKVTRLVVEDVPAGGKVTVNGAPARVTGGRASLTKRFKGRRLKPGAHIEIRVSAPNMTPRTIRFTIRAKKLPRKAVS